MKIYYPKELYTNKFRGHLFPLLKPFIKSEGFSNFDRKYLYSFFIQFKIISFKFNKIDVRLINS